MPAIIRSLLLILVFAGAARAQADSAFALKASLHADIVDFSVDNLGNLYVINSNNQLKKISPAGDSLAVYNDVRRYGKISLIDVTNPLKIILYYREFATVVILDRFLRTLNTLDLRKLNIFQAHAVALSYDNNLWVYDELEAKLKKIGDDGTVLSTTTDVRQFVDEVPEPSYIIDQNGLVYLIDETRGAYLFDYYGSYQRRIPLPGIEDFSVIDRNLLGRNDRFFFRYTGGNLSLQQYPIPAGYLPAIRILIRPNGIYVLKTGVLEIYVHQ